MNHQSLGLEEFDHLFIGHKSLPKDKQQKIARSKCLRISELILFSRVLAGLLEGGVSILKALEGIESSASRQDFRRMLIGLQDSIRRGGGLSEALRQSGVVPEYLCQTVYSGEISGKVPAVLNELAGYLEKEMSLRQSVRNALVYPSFILAAGFLTMAVLTCFVLPKLQSVYEGFGTELPLITTLILTVSRFFPLIVVFLAVSASAAIVCYRKSGPSIAKFFGWIYLGDFLMGYVRARFSRLMALLLDGGIPILETLSVAEKTFQDPSLRRDMKTVREAIAGGGHFSDCLKHLVWMDPVSRMLVRSGEETGLLAQAFSYIADSTEKMLDSRIQLVLKLLEPVLIFVIGLSVGIVVIGTVLPVFDMSRVVR